MCQKIDFEKLLTAIITECWSCECLEGDTYSYAWDKCYHSSAREDIIVKILGHERPNATCCMYRRRPSHCCVLAAVEKLAGCYLEGQHVLGPPVASELINAFDKSRKVEVRLVPSLKAIHGAVWLLGKEWVIQLNSREPRRARRYTMFHEAFHIVYRKALPAFKKVGLSHNPFADVLADHFATCFLMPKKWVEERWPLVQDV